MAKSDAQNFTTLGIGVTYAVVDNALILRIPMSPEALAQARPSKTGKTKLLATTNGFTAVPGADGIKIGLNVTAPLT